MTLTVGVVGAGNISRAHGKAWRTLDDVDLVVHSYEGAEEFAATFGATKVDGLDELLAASDLIDVVVPTYDHYDVVKAALQAGKDVICEKPLARTSEQARELVALAEELGRTIYPAHVVRYFPQYASARQVVADQGLGQLAVLRFQRTGNFPLNRGWYSDFELSGGITMDLLVHELDQAVWFAGPVQTVFAQHRTTDQPTLVETSQIVLTHTSGAITHLRGLWGPPETDFWYTFHVSGKDGTLRYDSRLETGFTLSGTADDAGLNAVGTSMFNDPYTAEITDFVRSWRDGTPARVSAQDGVTAVALAEAAQLSAQTNAPVDFTAFIEGSN